MFFNCSFCRGNFVAFFLVSRDGLKTVESRTDSIIEYEFGMTDHYLKKRMHTNLFFLQRISYNIMRDRYIDFMCIQINVTYIEIWMHVCKCKQIIYAYPNGSALNKESHSGNLYNIIAFCYRRMWKRRIYILSGGKDSCMELVNELLSVRVMSYSSYRSVLRNGTAIIYGIMSGR